VACFRNAASHLLPGGCSDRGERAAAAVAPARREVPRHRRNEAYWIDEYDVANQGLVSHHLTIVDDRFERVSIPFRYVWPPNST